MKNFTKYISIYTLVYSILSFILILIFFFLTVASRGFILFTPFMLLPFFTGFLYIVGLVTNVICFIKNNHNKKIRIFLTLILLCLIVEFFALFLPFIILFISKNNDVNSYIFAFSFISIPVTKIILLISSILILVNLKSYTNF